MSEFTNEQLFVRAERRAEASSNPAVGAALRRFLEHLPRGPLTPGELEVELEALDLSGLADSTASSYAGSIRSFLRDLRDGSG